MNNENNNSKKNNIVNSWSLAAFCQEYGHRFQDRACVNSQTGDAFNAIGVRNEEGDLTFLNYSKALQEDGINSVAKVYPLRKELQVVQLRITNDEGEVEYRYKLCRQGDGWGEEVIFNF